MRVHYTGKLEKLDTATERKLAARFAKLGTLLGRQTEKEAHVILGRERKNHRAEITVNYSGHALVGAAAGPDQAPALASALDRLEKQLLKLCTKRRDTARKAAPAENAPPTAGVDERAATRPRVIRVNNSSARKPMTAEEAILEIDARREYIVYRDADTDRPSVLVRRRDGNFDLIET